MDAQTLELIQIKEQQRKREAAETEQIVQDSQNELKRRVALAQQDVSINVGGSNE